jgi:hypothetical protein
MIKNETKAVFEGKMMGQDFNYGWMVQEPINARMNDKGIRNAPEMFQWAIDKDVTVTVESTKTNETKTFNGKIVAPFDENSGWLVKGERAHTCIEMFQWCIGHVVKVVVELISSEVQASP